ncbi:MAG: hypothetical protein GXP25_02900, partial [Planctomycetes bacterium]|nr:hypothetical protein [Planctomycetota bacterium]
MARIATLGRQNCLIGVFGLGLFLSEQSRLQRSAGYCNVCASLREMDHVIAEGFCDEFDYGDPVPKAPPTKSFDLCFLLAGGTSRGELGGLDHHARVVARFAHKMGHGDFLRGIAGFPASVQNSAQAPRQPLYSSFGIASIFAPRLDLFAFCMERWAEDVIAAMQQKQPSDPLHPDAQKAFQRVCSATPENCDAVGRRLASFVSRCADTTLLSGSLVNGKSAAEVALQEVVQLEKEAQDNGLTEEVERHIRREILDRFQKECRVQINDLLKSYVPGIGLALALLNRIHDPEWDSEDDKNVPILNSLQRKAKWELDNAKGRVESAIQTYRKQAKSSPASSPDGSSPQPPSMLFHPIRYWRWAKERKRLRQWVVARQAELRSLADAIHEGRIASAVCRGLDVIAEAVEVEKQALQELLNKLRKAARSIGEYHRARVPQPLGVDTSLIPKSKYETIYADYISQTEPASLNAALQTLVTEKQLLDDWRRTPLDKLKQRIEFVGEGFFRQAKELTIESLRETPDFEGFMSQLEELAEPLIDTTGDLMPDRWRPGERRALWLPEPDHPGAYSSSLATDQTLSVYQGSPYSIHLCRVVHGFPLNT